MFEINVVVGGRTLDMSRKEESKKVDEREVIPLLNPYKMGNFNLSHRYPSLSFINRCVRIYICLLIMNIYTV